MKIQALTKQAKPKSSSVSFEFDDNVDQFLVGPTMMYYTFGNKDHHVRQIKLGISPSNAGTNVDATVNMTLKDDSGNDISNDSYTDVTCLASTGQNTKNSVQLTGNLSFQSGSTSSQIGLNNTTYLNQSSLEGFDLSYDGDHHIKRIYAKTSVSVQQGLSVTLSGSDDMYDDSGNAASTKMLTAGYLGTYIDGNPSGIVSVTKEYDESSDRKSVDFSDQLGDKKLKEAAVFIKNFDLAFSKDHHMKYMKVGASDIKVEGNIVSFIPRAKMKDNSNNTAAGSVTLVVIGTCDAT